VQEVGLLVVFQESVALPPTYNELGLGDSDTTGGLGSTWMAALSKVLPVLLAHVIVKE
jgi:hypothetical protein